MAGRTDRYYGHQLRFPGWQRFFAQLLMAGRGVAASMVVCSLIITGCGSRSSGAEKAELKSSASAETTARGEAEMDRCVEAWNSSNGPDEVDALLQGGEPAYFFTYVGEECGITLPTTDESNGLVTYVQRGSNFESYVSSGGGFGKGADPARLDAARALNSVATRQGNATMASDGSARADSNRAQARKTTYSAAPTYGEVAQSADPDEHAAKLAYAVDGPTWEGYDTNQKITAVTQFMLDNAEECGRTAARDASKAIRDRRFKPEHGVQNALFGYCERAEQEAAHSGSSFDDTAAWFKYEAQTKLKLTKRYLTEHPECPITPTNLVESIDSLLDQYRAQPEGIYAQYNTPSSLSGHLCRGD